MKHIDLMVFDLDGTLVDSGNDIAASVNYTLKVLGIPTKKYEEILLYVGDGVQKLIERSLGEDNHHRFDDAMGIFSAYYAEHMLDSTTLYEPVIEVLEHFCDKRKVIITNKREYFTHEITNSLDISKYFEEIIGSDRTAFKKPDARLLLPLLEKYCAENHRAVVIGDGINDIKLAQNTGVLSCALLNGLTERNILLSLKPDFMCESLSELISLFS
jgi:phosphoglycolate phosphatase